MEQVSTSEYPLNNLSREWLSKIDGALQVKKERFQQYADEAMKFYDSVHDWMWKEEYATGAGGFLNADKASGHFPTFKMTVNRVFEAVALFGPALYHKNPNVLCTPLVPPVVPPEMLGIDPEDPASAPFYEEAIFVQEQQKEVRTTHAELQQFYLNWLQLEANKKDQARMAITEAIVKGLGLLWIEMHQPRGSKVRYPKATFVSVDDYVKDPDATYQDDVQWIARKCCHPVNLVERKYGLPPGSLKGRLQSAESQSTETGKRDMKSGKTETQSYDLITYWEIYSKNGMGQRLKTSKAATSKLPFDLDALGDFCYLAVAKNIPFPLNLPPSVMDPQEFFMRAQWPVPFWTDEGCGNGWPCAELHFYEKPKSVWPISLIKPAIGELRFVNWCMSFLADKVAQSCTTYVATYKAAALEIKNQLENKMAPFTMVEIADVLNLKPSELVAFLQAPEFNESIWRMLSEVLEMIDKRTGLTDLVYGLTGTQMRSAQEANIKNANTSVRPDEMANRTEDWLSAVAMKEMEAICWAGSREDVEPVLGPFGAQVFEQQILTRDFDSVVRDYAYRIEAGSARKPNKAQRLQSLTDFGNTAIAMFQTLAEQGVMGPWNAYMEDVAKALDLDPQRYVAELPQQEGPSPEEQKAQMEMQKLQAQLEMKRQESGLKLEQDAAAHAQDLDQDRERHTLEMELEREKAQMELALGSMKMQQQAAVANTQMRLKQQQATQQSQLATEKMKLQQKQQRQQALQKPSASKT